MIRNATYFTLGSSLSPDVNILFTDSSQTRSRVVLIREKDLHDPRGIPDQSIVQSMIDQAVCALVGISNVQKAWQQLFKPADVIGFKTNVWQYLPTPRAVELAVKKNLLGIGIDEKNISINDRGVLSDPVFQKATALINSRPMRSHAWSGVGSLLKNYIMFVPDPPSYHPDSCADLAKLWTLPIVKGKTRLNILVMFTPLFHGVGSHHFNAEYTWQYNGLLVGQDPVAVDSVGLRIIEAKRRTYFNEDRPLNPPAKHIMLAESRHHLGFADPGKIELIRLGWDQDALI
jgi:hypothetical protein